MLTVREYLSLIQLKNTFILKNIDSDREDRFECVDAFELSPLYNKIKDCEVFGIEAVEPQVLKVTYGEQMKVDLKLTADEAIKLRNILKDVNITPNNMNMDYFKLIHSIIYDIDNELVLVNPCNDEEDE